MPLARIIRWSSAILALAVLCGASLATPAHGSNLPPIVAAASDLQFALPEVVEAFAKETGKSVRISFGSSGNFARQLRQGAPYQAFFSADEEYVQALARDGVVEGDGWVYGIGRLALIVPKGSSLEADGSLASLKAALAEGRLGKLAIANPEHAPYGKRAREALQHKGLWDAVENRLVLGENVSQAAQFATSGSADGGIVAYALALSPKVAALASHALIPQDWHAPLRQRMVLTRGAGPVARQLLEFARTPVARAIFRKHGFTLPDETP